SAFNAQVKWRRPSDNPLTLYCDRPHRPLHSFPTRRSSDLISPKGIPPKAIAETSSKTSDGYGESSTSKRSASFAIQASSSGTGRSEEHTSELQSRFDIVCRLLLEKKHRPRPRVRPPGRLPF